MTEPAEPLNFDQAQSPQPSAGATCGHCQQTIADRYFEANGVVLCAVCKERLEAGWKGGSKAARFFKAGALGAGGGLLGALIWFAVSHFTGYELGLIAIVVGFLVGKGISIGSEYRGGRLYQVLAIVLTYLAIVSTYVPAFVEEFDKRALQDATAAVEAGNVAPEAAPRFLVYAVSAVVALAAPFLAGLENLMGLLIIAIALWEAWKLTAKRELTFNGPFDVATPTEPAAEPAVANVG